MQSKATPHMSPVTGCVDSSSLFIFLQFLYPTTDVRHCFHFSRTLFA